MINIYLNSAYPATEKVYSNELNANGGRKLNIAFWSDDSTPYDLTDKEVTATFVTNKTLIADSILVSDKNENTIELDISSNSDYTIIPGDMLVEFEFKEGDKVTSPATAMIVHVRGSIKNDAKITPDSYGTVADIVKEVIAARGNYDNLPERLNAQESEVSTLKQRMSTAEGELSGVERDLSGKVNYIDLGNTSHNIFDINTDEKTIYHAKVSEVGYEEIEYTFYTVTKSSTERAQYRFSINGIEMRTYRDGEWEEFSSYLTINAPNVTVWDYETSAANNFTVPTTFEGKIGDMVILTTGTGIGGAVFILKRTISAYGSTSYYWENVSVKEQLEELEEKALNKPSVSIGFDTDGVVKATANVTGLNLSLGGSTSVYVASKVTQITENFGRSGINPDLTYLYVDNEQGIVNIDESILNDSNITIYYRGEFKLVDLLSNSQFRLNTRITAVETLIGDIEDLIDTELNLEEE